MDFECLGNPYAVLSSTPGKASPIFRAVSKSIVLLGTGQSDSLEPRYRHEYASTG